MQLTSKGVLRACTALMLSGYGSTVMADPPSNAQATIQPSTTEATPVAAGDIIVTAQRRSERLNDVPMSITAASGVALAEHGVTAPSQLDKIVSGFTYQQSTNQTPVFTIRGVGFYDTSIGADPAVTVYIDQIPLPYSIMTKGAVLDLERVEALKGPQGTLFGNNSTGGAINFVAAKPSETLKAGLDMSYGSYNDFLATGFVSGPLSDTFAVRVALSHESAQGWQQSISRPGDHTDGKDFTNGRILVDWKPSSNLKFELNLNGWRDRGTAQAFQFVQAIKLDQETQYNAYIYNALAHQQRPASIEAADWYPGQDMRRDDRFYQAALKGDWEINSEIALSSITNYAHMDMNEPFDVSGNAFPSVEYPINIGTISAFSQELRLSGHENHLKWMVGGNYAHNTTSQFQVSNLNVTNTVIPQPDGGALVIDMAGIRLAQNPTTKAAFGSLEYEITPSLTAQGSARYTDESRTFTGCATNEGIAPSPAGGPPGISFGDLLAEISSGLTGTPQSSVPVGACSTLNATTFLPGAVVIPLVEHNVSWKVGLKWKPETNTLLYANITKGYKAGSFSDVYGNISNQFQAAPQESVLAYEVGFKQSAFEHNVDLTGAGFYYNYHDKQFLGTTETILGAGAALATIPKSYVLGAELSLAARPVARLSVNLSATYVKSKVQSDPINGEQALDPFGNATSFIGEAFPNTPKWTGTADATYTFPLKSDWSAYLGSSVNFRSAAYAAFGEIPSYLIDAYAVLNLNAGVKSADGKWRAEIWTRNVTNTDYATNVYSANILVLRTVGNPRTIGASVGLRY